MRFAVVTLDLDGTVWDSGPALARAEHAVYRWLAAHYPRIAERYALQELIEHRRALAARRPDLRHDFTRLRRAALAALAEEAGYDASLAEAAMTLFVAERSRVALYEDAVPALARLSRRYRLVALTNGNADVRRTGLAHLFDLVLSPAVTGVAKPDPAVFRHVFERFEVAGEAVVHVGDEPETDVECARRAGITAVWVNRAAAPWPQCAPPAAEIRSLAELEGALHRLAENQSKKQDI